MDENGENPLVLHPFSGVETIFTRGLHGMDTLKLYCQLCQLFHPSFCASSLLHLTVLESREVDLLVSPLVFPQASDAETDPIRPRSQAVWGFSGDSSSARRWGSFHFHFRLNLFSFQTSGNPHGTTTEPPQKKNEKNQWFSCHVLKVITMFNHVLNHDPPHFFETLITAESGPGALGWVDSLSFSSIYLAFHRSAAALAACSC